MSMSTLKHQRRNMKLMVKSPASYVSITAVGTNVMASIWAVENLIVIAFDF